MQKIAFKVRRRLNWYKARFQVNNPIVGRAVELLGDRVRMDGLTYSVAAPQITRGHKSTLAFGLHEMEERELIRRWLPSDLPVIEFGGGLGVVSCLTNKKLEDPKSHVVVEANPAMIPVLEHNREINACRFTVHNRALAYGTDFIELDVDAEFVGSSIKTTNGHTVRVPTTTLGALMDAHKFGQAGVVCDIEGAEADLIRNELTRLGERVRFLMAEMHPNILGIAVVDSLLEHMSSLGFDKRQQIGDSVFFSR